MDDITALHTAARRYCLDRGAYISMLFDDSVGKRLLGAGHRGPLQPTKPATIVREDHVLGAILLRVESVVPASFASLEELRSYLLDAGRTAQTELTQHAPADLQQVADAYREAFCRYIAGLSPRNLREIMPLPYRRLLGLEEIAALWTRVWRRWGAHPGRNWYPQSLHDWYPVDRAEVPGEVLALQTPWFVRSVPVTRLRQILAAHGIKRVWQLHMGGVRTQFEMDLDLLPGYFNNETYYTSEAMDWLLYGSLEHSITVAGAWLVAEVKRAWPEWQQHVYTSYVFPHPGQDLHASGLPGEAGRLVTDLNSGSPERVARARAVLAGLGAQPSEPLLALLQGVARAGRPEYPSVTQALRAAGRAVVPGLIATLTQDGVPRDLMVRLLGEVGDPRAVGPLLDLLEDERELDARVAAVNALARLGDRRAVAPLLAVLSAHGEGQGAEYHAILQALGRLRDERAVAALVERLIWPDRAGAGRALVDIGEPAVLPLIAVLGDRSRATNVREAAIPPLIQLRDQRALRPALAVVCDPREAGDLRRRAMPLVGRLGGWRDPSTLAALVSLRDEDASVRASAVPYLARIDGEHHASLLLGLLRDPTEKGAVRAAVVLELPGLAPSQALDLLVGALDDGAPAVWGAAAEALKDRGDERVLSQLVRLWHESGGPVLAG